MAKLEGDQKKLQLALLLLHQTSWEIKNESDVEEGIYSKFIIPRNLIDQLVNNGVIKESKGGSVVAFTKKGIIQAIKNRNILDRLQGGQ